MNLGAVFAVLIQIGACAPVDFSGTDGTTLRVLVCPVKMAPAQPAEPPAAPPGEDMTKPPGPGKMDG